MFSYQDAAVNSTGSNYVSRKPKGLLVKRQQADGWQISDVGGDLYFCDPPHQAAVCLPTVALADALIAEWPERTPTTEASLEVGTDHTLSQISKLALLGTKAQREAKCTELANFLHSDTLAYWQRSPDGLHDQQRQHWGALLDWCRETYGDAPKPEYGWAALIINVGCKQAVVHFLQAQSPFAVAALAMIVPISGSVILGMAQCSGRISPQQAFTATNLEALYQQQHWGHDAEAEIRLARQKRAFELAGLCFDT